jgi:hypothetical protein
MALGILKILLKGERRREDFVNFNRICKLAFVTSMVLVLCMSFVAAYNPVGSSGPYVDSLWQSIIISDDEYVTALVTHELDSGGIPRPEDIGPITDPVPMGAGFTKTVAKRIGQTFTFPNNRVWPFGIPYIYPEPEDNLAGYKDPAWLQWEDEAEAFRKAVHRLINKDEIVAELYDPLMSKAEAWLPPGQIAWINPDAPFPDYDPTTAVALLDAAGFVQADGLDGRPHKDNPYWDPDIPWSAEHIRIDPVSQNPLDEMTYTYETPFGSITWTGIEYYAIGPVESPLGFEMATMIADWLRTAGIPVNLVAGSWLGMVIRLVNDPLEDYMFMTGVGIVWGSTAPDILYDFTYSLNLPLWNFVYMNYTALDDLGEAMFLTLDVDEMKSIAFDIQTLLGQHEPYMPLLLWNVFGAFTGPWGDSQGYLGIVNALGFGARSTYEEYSKMLGRADRQASPEEIMIWGLGAYLDTLNPLMADTVADWTVLHTITDSLIELNPYNHKYMPWAADVGSMETAIYDPVTGDWYFDYMRFNDRIGYVPYSEKWVGPGRTHAGGNGVYDAPVTYKDPTDPDPWDIATYNGTPVEEVTEADLVNDDTLGMVTFWKLRDGPYWHDSDPGPDMKFGTADDGTVYPVTTADLDFMMDILIKQNNVRYFSAWWYVHDYVPLDAQRFRVYEERRWVFAFEAHGVGLLGPKHLWEPFIAGPDGELWTDDDRHHSEYNMWEIDYMDCPIHPGYRLSELIGFGPYHYHISGPPGVGPGWEVGVSTHVEANYAYFGTMAGPFWPEYADWPVNYQPSRINGGDVDLNQVVDEQDQSFITDAFGSTPWVGPWDPKADISYAAQIIDLDDVFMRVDNSGYNWGPFIPIHPSALPRAPAP